MERRLIINADDYGRSHSVNRAVEELARAGRLGGVSVLTNGECFAEAAAFLRRHQAASPGIHFNAVEGYPLATAVEVELLLNEQGKLAGRGALLKQRMLRQRALDRAVEMEWAAQLEQLLAAGVVPVHADSHQHMHAFPPFFTIAVRLCRRYNIPAIRIPNERVRDRVRLIGLLQVRASLAVAQALTATVSLARNDHFLGFRRAGGYKLDALLADIARLPAGLTELGLHPSFGESPYVGYAGDEERQALLSDKFTEALRQAGVRLVSWAEAQVRPR